MHSYGDILEALFKSGTYYERVVGCTAPSYLFYNKHFFESNVKIWNRIHVDPQHFLKGIKMWVKLKELTILILPTPKVTIYMVCFIILKIFPLIARIWSMNCRLLSNIILLACHKTVRMDVSLQYCYHIFIRFSIPFSLSILF